MVFFVLKLCQGQGTWVIILLKDNPHLTPEDASDVSITMVYTWCHPHNWFASRLNVGVDHVNKFNPHLTPDIKPPHTVASAKRSGRYDATDYATWEHREHGATEDAYEGPPPTACQREDADGDADNQDPAEDADREEGTAGDSIDALSPSSSVSNSNPRAKPHNTDWDVCERGPVVELHDPKISDFISTRNQFSSLKRSEVG